MSERKWHQTLTEMERAYKDGYVTENDLNEYLAAWNATEGRFTRAYWRDGAIRQEVLK